jgi:hypothetical protein
MKASAMPNAQMPNAEGGNQAWNHSFGILHVALGIQAGRFFSNLLSAEPSTTTGPDR